MEDKNRSKAIALAVASIEKEYGKGSIMRLKEGQTLTADVPVVPTGSIGLDLALGIGGYPRGRIIEVYGPESSGKTTLTLHAIASMQKQGGVAAFIDAEHALDPTYARKLGVKTDELLISQPDFGEQALEIADMLVRSGDVIDLASDMNLDEKSGAWYSYAGERIGQGRENAKAFLELHPEIMDKLEQAILLKHGIKRANNAQANGSTPPAEVEEKPKRVAQVQGKPAN